MYQQILAMHFNFHSYHNLTNYIHDKICLGLPDRVRIFMIVFENSANLRYTTPSPWVDPALSCRSLCKPQF